MVTVKDSQKYTEQTCTFSKELELSSADLLQLSGGNCPKQRDCISFISSIAWHYFDRSQHDECIEPGSYVLQLTIANF